MRPHTLILLCAATWTLAACEDDTPAGTVDTTVATDTAVADTTPEDTFPATPDTSPLGGERPASVYMPVGYDAAQAWPMVMLLHGYTASGALQDGYLQFHARATEAGFLVVVPEGTKNSMGEEFWNASPAWCCDFESSGVDDQQYLLDVIAEAKTRFNVDADKVFLFGHSNGGFMSYTMACEHADVIAGIASLAGSGYKLANDCDPSEPVTVMQIHGTLDAVIAYSGTGDFPGAVALTDRWTVFNGCTTDTHVSGSINYDTGVIGEETIRTTWDSCDNGAAVALWTMKGSSHLPFPNAQFVPDVLGFLLAHTPTTE